LIKKKDEMIITIDDLTVDGHGIGRHEGFTVFVPGALPGETVKASVIKLAKNYCVARLLEIIKPSPARIKPPCPYYKRCGGCTLQHLSYEKQLEYKTEYVKSCLKRLGGLDISVHSCVPSPKEYGYRNKSSFPVAQTKDSIITGYYAPYSHQLIDIEQCLIMDEKANRALNAVRAFFKKHKVSAYDEEKHEGLHRHIIIRSVKNGELMVAAVVNGPKMPHEKEWVGDLTRDIEGLSSLVLNSNIQKTNVILGEKEKVLSGKEYLLEEISGLAFAVSLKSFLQVNREQSERLYEKALEYADIAGDDIVADLFCGIGTLTLLAARKAKKAYGIEIVQSAIKNADENKRINHIENAEFICADVSDALPKLMNKEKNIDIVLLDPPRKGCGKSVLEAVLKALPKRIVYISCDPATLSRDIKILAEGGYVAKEAAPFDMFPQTTHVETIVWMSRTK